MMMNDLEQAAERLIQQEEKIREANRTALNLLNQLKEADLEIESLKTGIQRLQKQKELYKAVKDDDIDMALADFLNNYVDRGAMEVMFIRLQPGIYSFGSKKVCIKVDNGKICVRVGGGFMRIDEFIEQYTTTEIERSLRDDPVSGMKSPLKR